MKKKEPWDSPTVWRNHTLKYTILNYMYTFKKFNAYKSTLVKYSKKGKSLHDSIVSHPDTSSRVVPLSVKLLIIIFF